MAIKTKTELKDAISKGVLTSELLIDFVDSFYSLTGATVIDTSTLYSQTPVSTSTTRNINIASSSISRVGENVYFNGSLTLETSSNSSDNNYTFFLILPVESNFTSDFDASGIFNATCLDDGLQYTISTKRIQAYLGPGISYLEFVISYPPYSTITGWKEWEASFVSSYKIK